MREAIHLPAFGEGVAEAEIIAWLKEEGDQVERGDDVLEVATSKATMTVAAPNAGILSKKMLRKATMLMWAAWLPG